MQIVKKTDKIWYHGDANPRTFFTDQKWDRDPQVSSANAFGPGLYWTDSLEQAKSYGPYLYRAQVHANFNMLTPNRKPTLAMLKKIHGLAHEEDRERFKLDWGVPSNQALRKYLAQDTLFDAFLGLYGDLIRSPDHWVRAVQTCGFDGSLVHRDYGVKNLIVYDTSKVHFVEM